jgi:hypothetical protein
MYAGEMSVHVNKYGTNCEVPLVHFDNLLVYLFSDAQVEKYGNPKKTKIIVILLRDMG